MSVEKDVLYADRARYFPWRPRLWMAAYDILTYSAVAQVRVWRPQLAAWTINALSHSPLFKQLAGVHGGLLA